MLTIGAKVLRSLTVAIPLSLAALAAPAASARSLSFDERVACQQAIERIYHSHRIGAPSSFEASLPREALEAKVRKSLEQSIALERRWRTPLTAAALQRELRRIAEGTRFPERLQEIYTALGEDPFLVQECLARPVLVDRLARHSFASDAEIHAEPRARLEEVRDALERGSLDVRAEHPLRRVVTLQVAPAELPGRRAPGAHDVRRLTEEEFLRERAGVPREVGRIGPIVEARDRLTVSVVLDEHPWATTIATYEVRKGSWDDWWAEARRHLDLETVAVSDARVPLPLPGAISREGGASHVAESVTSCVPDDTWDNGRLDDSVDARQGATAVWTGTEMIVWGGGGLQNGGRYDPLTDTWKQVSTIGAPAGRHSHTAVWTGAEMLVWGGRGGPPFSDALADGGRYDPASDTWAPISTIGAPVRRVDHTAVWTGSRMIVWGGSEGSFLLGSGGSYDPQSDTWTALATLNAPGIRHLHTAVWTGEEMIIWGGADSLAARNTGGRYDPDTHSWTPTTMLGVPSARYSHAAVWTGTHMIVWGGAGGGTSGARYEPASGTWVPTSTADAPAAREQASSIWTGSQMIVWGGLAGGQRSSTGGRYDPVADTWSPTPIAGAPSERVSHTAIWTGGQMIVWGGRDDVATTDTGARYDPQADVWTAVWSSDAPGGAASSAPGGVWTGNVMISWHPDGAGRYDPLLDAWAPVSAVGEPLLYEDITAVWTGTEMIIWGEVPSPTGAPSGGGRYNPVTDSWAPVSTLGAPESYWSHSAVWTGEVMIVWGGYPNLQTGGRYDPVTDSWAPTSTVGAAEGRYGHTAVWTGTEMIVWGGEDRVTGEYFRVGGRYDPATDTWAPTTAFGAPLGRLPAVAVWTGDRMMVWGQFDNGAALSDGALYDPVADSWTHVSAAGAPSPRWFHSMIWTGSRAIVWGGSAVPGNAEDVVLNTGASYDPLTDSWSPTALAGAPAPRRGHLAVWTGRHMLVWGGQSLAPASGGRYAIGHAADLDGDGFSLCGGDCDDGDADSHPGAAEACDGRDNDCNGALPVGEEDGDGDGALACRDCDDSDPQRYPGKLEVCDGVDDDCDGVYSGHATSCGAGACASAGVCVGGIDNCTPGAPSPEACNGIDDDCNGSLPSAEADADGDGLGSCQGDCADGDYFTRPGRPERNDGRDNQCGGEPGDGLVDELPGPIGFTNPQDPLQLCWPAQAIATRYEVLRSTTPEFAGECKRARVFATCWSDPEPVAPRTAVFYLVQATAPYLGSLGLDSSGLARTDVCGVEVGCGTGADLDGDGAAGCEDSDCLGRAECTDVTLQFIDTAGDDVAAGDIETFFGGMLLGTTDHLLLSIQDASRPDVEICLGRADFYRDSYLALAANSGIVSSGGWPNWYRPEGGSWEGPFTQAHESWFGDDCVGPYSWCPEVDLGSFVPGIAPAEPGICEAFEGIACSTFGSWITLRVGVDQTSACRF